MRTALLPSLALTAPAFSTIACARQASDPLAEVLPAPKNYPALEACAESLVRVVPPAPPPPPAPYDIAYRAFNAPPDQQLATFLLWLQSDTYVWEACYGLTRLRAQSAVPALLSALARYSRCPITPLSEAKRLLCLKTLERVTGANPGSTESQWRAWWHTQRASQR